MKNLKKLSGILLAIAVLLACTVSAFALTGTNDDNGKISINNAVSGQVYNIYQILKLESFDNSVDAFTYKVAPGWEGFVPTAGNQNEYLKTDSQGYVTWVGADTDAAKVAFAKAARAYVAEVNSDGDDSNNISPTRTETASSADVVFAGLNLGYYLLDTSLGTLCSLDTTDKEVVILEKNTEPTINKEVQEDSDSSWSTSNTAQIGDTVNFKITVSAKNGADNYKVSDTMDPGFTLKADTIAVKVGDTPLDSTDDYTLTSDVNAGTFNIVFKQTYLDTITTNTDIVITYSATLNKDAEIAVATNDNTATLTYGDNNTSVDATTSTKTFKFDIVKTTSANKLLTGAEFKLYDAETNGNEIPVVKVGNVYRVAVTGETGVAIEATNGKATVIGLDANTTYYLQETKQPAGYNILADRVPVAMGTTNIVNNTPGDTYTDGDGGILVVNYTGAELPSTGGIGTTIFYIVGGVLVAAAVVLLVAKKRTSENR